MSCVRDSVPIQRLSQWYRESGFPQRKPGLLHHRSMVGTSGDTYFQVGSNIYNVHHLKKKTVIGWQNMY
jgi:hypothetical protein